LRGSSAPGARIEPPNVDVKQFVTLRISLWKDAQLEPNRENTRYRTADVCSVLGISPDLFRWRVLSGKYPDVKKDGRGRVFTLEDIDKLVQIRPELDQQRADAAKKRWKKSFSR
jgi:hypothetical protein